MNSKLRLISGFSLLELVLVIAIISTLVAYAIPQYQIMKIKAARAEAYINLRSIKGLADAYHADHSEYPNSFSYGLRTHHYGAESSGRNVPSNACIENELGFSTTTCEKNRYYYSFVGTGDLGNSIDNNRRLYYTISAQSTHIRSSTYGVTVGNPNVRCPGRATGTGRDYGSWNTYFSDHLTMFETGLVQPLYNDLNYDAVHTCYNGKGQSLGYAPPPRNAFE